MFVAYVIELYFVPGIVAYLDMVFMTLSNMNVIKLGEENADSYKLGVWTSSIIIP